MKKLFISRRLDVLLLGLLTLIIQGDKPAQPVIPGMVMGQATASIPMSSGMIDGPVLHPTSAKPLFFPYDPRALPDGSHNVLVNGNIVKVRKGVMTQDFKDGARKVAARESTSKPVAPPTTAPTATGELDENCGGGVGRSDIPEDTPDYAQRHGNRSGRRGPSRHRRDRTPSPTKVEPERVPANSEPGTSPAQPPAPPTGAEDPAAEPKNADVPPPAGAPVADDSPVTDTLYTAELIGDAAKGNELVDAALAARRVIAHSAEQDQRILGDSYRSLDMEGMAERLTRAQENIRKSADIFEQNLPSSLEASEKARFRNHFLNAQDKAQLGLDAIRDQQQAKEKQGLLGANSPLAGLLGFGVPRTGDPLAKNPALADIFGGGGEKAEGDGNGASARRPASGPNATNNEALTNRIVMLNGLPDQEREQALERLKLLERSKFNLPGGRQVTINLPHNGYLLGGGASAVDCSSFVSSVLPADVRRGSFTTLDFRAMWIYARTQKFPSPPKYTPERAKLVKETSDSFTPINLYSGETLRVGDILTYRFESDPIGHVVIVRSYNPDTLRAEIIEAAQSAGTVRERTLNLSADPLTVRKRYLMPGLWPLRLKSVSSKACTYKESVRVPASQPEPAPLVEAPSPEGSAR